MRYIYDILVDFKKTIYDFYDWNKEDEVINIRKTPVIKLDKKDFHNFYFSKVAIKDKFLDKIENKTDVFHKIQFKVLRHVCVFTDGEEVLAVKFENGENVYVSKLIFEEAEEVIDISEKLKVTKIEYEIISSREILLETRKENKINQYIKKELKKY